MIDDLRKRLDDATFRRNNRNESKGFSIHRLAHQHTLTRKYENVPSIYLEESETELHQIKFCHDEYEDKKSQNDIKRISTLFGERLHKRIMEEENEKTKQKALKLSAEVKTKEFPKKDSVENNKENGSQFSINNNESSYKKNLMKRTNEEDNTYRNKRLKIENKTTTKEIDIARYNLIDNPVQYEMKDNLAKFEDRLGASSFLKKEKIPIHTGHRAASEHQDIKQDKDCTNGWKSERKNNSGKDLDGFSIRNDDDLRKSRTPSVSSHASERFNSDKKNEYKYSPSRRSSKSRSNYESTNSHRLRERSNRTYKEKKYDDYKYDSRYKSDRLKRNYKSEENDSKAKHRRFGEHSVLRDKSKYSSSDAEDKEGSSSHKNKKYEIRRMKKMTANILNDRKLEENKVIRQTDSQKSSSRTISNTIAKYSIEKSAEQHKMKNEPEMKSIKEKEENLITCITMENLNIMEEGEILDSPEKKNSTNIFKDNKIKEDNVKIENKNILINTFTDELIDHKSILQTNTKQLEVANINTKKIEETSHSRENSKDYGEIIYLNSGKTDMTVNEVHYTKDEDICISHTNEDLMDIRNIRIIEQVCDSDIDINNKNDADKILKDSIVPEITTNIQGTDFNVENVIKIKELIDSNIESATKKKEIDDPNIESTVEADVNNINSDNNMQEIDDKQLKSSIKVTKVETVLECNIKNKDLCQIPIPIGSKISHQTSNKNDVEIHLNDHNYVQKTFTNVSDFDASQKPLSNSEYDEAVLEIVTSKEIKSDKTINVQSINAKRTIPAIVKNKKDQQDKGIVILHRRRAVILSDSNASMTILMNTDITETSSVINNCNDNDSVLKPRACKTPRVFAKATCK
ncbi:uncharacterized protein LOC105431003 [Pogonomyrmex barbatus]|uniref:Uncharacterized protein LOC105431003 n=1 Tax=Pogonomyrmex barbatus TaxID=144034 RepID=A0A8N1SAP3_9HYME|nr:uncharacterized protein LOC105431003 [Pogonomyrmex barbatus]